MSHPADPVKSPPKGAMRVILALALIAAIGPFSLDMYLPAMPQMGAALSASPAVMQMTVTGYLIGVAVGPLVLGPISDAYGRKPAQTALLLLYAAASAGCALAATAETLIAFRVAQAFAGGAAGVTARAMLADLYRGDALSRATSILMSIFTAAPVIAPLIGAWLLEIADWRWIFWALVLFSFLALGALQFLPETLPPAARRPYRPRAVIAGYFEIMSSAAARRYLASTFAFAFMFFGMLAASPFIFIEHFGVSPGGFAMIFAATSLAALAANLVNARVVFRYGYDGMLRRTTWGLALLAAVMGIVAATGLGGIWGVFGVMIWLMGVFAVSSANIMAGLMQVMGHRAGAASAAMAFWRFLGGALGSFTVGAFNTSHPWPFALVLALAAVGAALALRLGRAEARRAVASGG